MKNNYQSAGEQKALIVIAFLLVLALSSRISRIMNEYTGASAPIETIIPR